MKRAHQFYLCVVLAGFPLVYAYAVDDDAPVVKLRYDDPANPNDGCFEEGVGLNNCFTDLTAMRNWIMNVRHPNAAAPLLIEIGPGTFTAPVGAVLGFSCAGGEGFMTFRGAGRGATLITGYPAAGQSLFRFGGCQQVAFESLTLEGTNQLSFTVQWDGSGSSVWTNVEVRAVAIPWYDNDAGGSCDASTRGKHEWFSSVLRSVRSTSNYLGLGVHTYYSFCGDSWFWGSEIENLNINTVTSNGRSAIRASGGGSRIHLYGSNIRVYSDTTTAKPLKAVDAMDGASVHMHGTGIDVEANGDAPIIALAASTGAEIHANQSSYVLRTGTGGTVTRISKDGSSHIHAPYLWEHVPDPTTMPSFQTLNGADQTTVTEETNDGHPHTAVYSTACPPNARWYDQVDQVCRSK